MRGLLESFVRNAVFLFLSVMPVVASPPIPVSNATHPSKLDSIILPEVELNKIPFRIAVDYLNERILENDSAGSRVRLYAWPQDPDLTTHAPDVTLSMRDATLRQVLDNLCSVANLGLPKEGGGMVVLHVLPPSAETAARQKIMHKLASLIIAHLSLNKVDVATAIGILNRKAKEADPEHVGAEIVYRPPPKDWPSASRKVEMTLDGAPLDEILGYMVEQINLDYIVIRNKVLVALSHILP